MSTETAKPSSARRSAWIISPLQDLTLLIVSPLAIFPLLTIASKRWYSPETVALFVFAFASLGHHLPGLMRAYGDRELFSQNRSRFLLAPPALMALSWLFLVRLELHGLELVLLAWSTWHVLMQTYGLMRIYDLKSGQNSSIDAWCDFGACVAVFAYGFLLSDVRMFGFLESLWLTGVPPFDPFWIRSARGLTIAMAACALAAFLVRAALRYRQDSHSVSLPKILLLATTAWLYWKAGQLSVNLLIGVAVFEVFHAIQYYAIVWYYNRKKVDRVGTAFGPMKALFDGKRWGLPVYLIAIAAFGSLGLVGRFNPDAVSKIAAAIFGASAMLHFYYDGFIWKVSRRSTGTHLGVDGGVAEPRRALFSHGLQWSVLLLICGTLGIAEYRSRERLAAESSQRMQALVAITPNLPELQARMSHWHLLQGDTATALATASQAVAARPRSFDAQLSLGNALSQSAVSQSARSEPEDWARAELAFAKATALRPDSLEAHFGLGLAAIQTMDYDVAKNALTKCLRLQPKHAAANFQLGNVHYALIELPEAIARFRDCTKLEPTFAQAHNNLGAALFDDNQLRESANAYLNAIGCDSSHAAAHYNLGLVYLALGEKDQARTSIVQSIELGQRPSAEILWALGLK